MQQVDDPPYLTVGTEVSAKYKGAFCEAKVRKVDRNIKCKVAYKLGLGSGTVSDDQIRGDQLRVGAAVEVRHPDRKDYVDATITKIVDSSQYTVVFDDGDITTLRRSALCLKSGRHFNESETLDQLPLTHPEHFGNPVIGGRRGGRRSRHMPEDNNSSDDDEDNAALIGLGGGAGGSGSGAGGAGGSGKRQLAAEKEEHIGKVVCVENTDTKKKNAARDGRENWFPALVVAPTAQDAVRIRVKDEYLVRSFKDGRYYTVPKKEATEFRRDKHTQARQQQPPSDAVQAALDYLSADALPAHWDRDVLFALAADRSSDTEASASDSDTSDDEPREEKDHFVAQLYKYMDDRGTPLNKGPSICNRDVDLYRLFRAVQKLNGYNKVTGQSQWKQIAVRLGYAPVTQSVQNLVKQAYKKFLLPFEEFDRKLGCTMVAHPRANRIKGRSLLRANSVASPKPDRECKASQVVVAAASAAAAAAATVASPAAVAAVEPESSESTTASSVESGPETSRAKRKLSTGSGASGNRLRPTAPFAEKLAPQSQQPKAPASLDSDDEEMPVPLATIALAVKLEETAARQRDAKRLREAKEAAKDSKEPLLKDIKLEKQEAGADVVAPPVKSETKASAVVKEEQPSITHRSPSGGNGPPNAGGSAGRKEKMPKRPPPPTPPACGPSATSGGDEPVRKPSQVATKKRRSEADAEKSTASASAASSASAAAASSASSTASSVSIGAAAAAVAAAAADPNDFPIEVGDKLKVFYHEQKTTYEAKVIEVSVQLGTAHYLVHYTGWNTRYDEWVPKERIAENLTNNRTNKKAKTGGAPSLSRDKFMAAAAAAGNSAASALATTTTPLSTPASAATSSSSVSAPTSTSKALFKRGRGSSRGESQPPRSTTPSSVASNSSRTKSPATPAAAHQRRTTRGQPSSSSSVRRRTSNNTDMSSLPTDDDSDTDSDEPVKKPASVQTATATAVATTTSTTLSGRKAGPMPRGQSLPAASTTTATLTSATTAIAAQATLTASVVVKSLAASVVERAKSSSASSSVISGGGTKSNSIGSSEEESMTGLGSTAATTTTTTTTATVTGRMNPVAASTGSSKGGRDFDLNQIRSELKGFKELKSPSAEEELDDDDDDDDNNDDNASADDEELDDEAERNDDDEDETTGDDTADDTALRRRKSKPAFPDFGSSSTSHSNSTTVSDDPRTKPTVSSDSADSEASDSFGDDDSQFSDKTTTLANLSEKLQEKFKAGKLQTDVFKRATAAAAAAATTTSTASAAAAAVVTTVVTPAATPSVVVPVDAALEKVATLKASGIEKIIKSTLAEKSKVLPEKPTNVKPLVAERSPTKASIAAAKSSEPETTAAPTTTAVTTTVATKSPTKPGKPRTIGEKGMFSERQKAAAAIAEKFPHRDLFAASGSSTPSRSDSGVISSIITPKKTAAVSPPQLRDEGDIYEFKEPEPFEFEAVKKISPESDKKTKKKSFADKLNTSPLSSAVATPVPAKKTKKSPAKEAEKPPKQSVVTLRPLDVDMDVVVQTPAPPSMASPPMLFGSSSSSSSSKHPESIFDSLRKSPSFNLSAQAAANERDEFMVASTSADAAAFDTTPLARLVAPTPVKPSFISSFVETSSPTKPAATSATSGSSLLPSVSVPVPPNDAATISSSTSASASSTSIAVLADTLKVFVPGPNSDSDTDDDTTTQLATVKKILLADEVYEAPPKPDKPCSIADKVLKALNQQKCDQLAAAAAAAAAPSIAATTTTATVATKTSAIVPGSAVPVSTSASTALTVATDSAKPRNELHAMLRATDMGAANKPILNSPDNSKFIAVDEAKNQDLSDTIKKLRGVVQPTQADGDADLFADSDDEDSTGSERLVIEDVVVVAAATTAAASPQPVVDRKPGSRESSRSGFERVESPVRLVKKATVAAADAKESRKSTEPKETKKAAAARKAAAAAEAKKDVHIVLPAAPESQTIIVKPIVLNPVISIEPIVAVKAPPPLVPANIAATIKLVPSIADLNQLAPRVFASIVPLPESIKPTVQHVAKPVSMSMTLRAESPLATPLVSATMPTANAEEDADEDDDEDDDDDDDANGFGNSKLVIVTKDEDEDDEEDDDEDEEHNDVAETPAVIVDGGRLGVIIDATPAIKSSEFERCPSNSSNIAATVPNHPLALSPARYLGTIAAIHQQQQQQHQQQQHQQQQLLSQQPNESLSLLMCEETIPGSPTPPTCPKEPGGTVRNEPHTEDDDDDGDDDTADDDEDGGSHSKRNAYNDPTSSAPTTSAPSTIVVQALPATASDAVEQPQSTTTTTTTATIIAQHAHPTGANIKPEPMDLEPCTGPPMMITVKTEPIVEATASSVRSLNAAASATTTAISVTLTAGSVITTQASAANAIAVAAHQLPPTTMTTVASTAAPSVSVVMVPLPMVSAAPRRDSFSNDDSDDVRKNVDNGSFAENRKRRRSKKASECESAATATNTSIASATKRRKNTSRRNTVTGSESEDNTGEYVAQKSAMSSQRSGPTKPCQYNFLVQLDPALNSHQRISIIHKKIQDLRKTYNHLKGELASIDRRRKKLRRRDRETKKLKQRLIDGIAANG